MTENTHDFTDAERLAAHLELFAHAGTSTDATIEALNRWAGDPDNRSLWRADHHLVLLPDGAIEARPGRSAIRHLIENPRRLRLVKS
ncbi:hypothetical protein [Rhodococcus sp. ACPA1]|uniref:hypothetical protein n=1 Tax=Rhodococcus sp. ACPA1 TaxID=2028572 RepID=UPI000BB15BF8|nr:hypothetical protein [Rhodococcus sp. ACPA1]PBC54898.1 hypothetical protein CJ177_17970 [Rhodococcus sp. ACPA1]